jgi:hypothetical protein
LLAARFERSVHVEADRFFDFIEAGYVEPWLPESHEQNATVMQIVGDVAAAYAEAGYFTIIDGIVIPRWFLGPLRERLAAAGHESAYAVLRPQLALCLARRQHVPADVVEGVWNQFADLGDWEPNVIEVADDETPAQVVDELAERLT